MTDLPPKRITRREREQKLLDEATSLAHERLRALYWQQWTALMREAYDEVDRKARKDHWARRNQARRMRVEAREQAAQQESDRGHLADELELQLA